MHSYSRVRSDLFGPLPPPPDPEYVKEVQRTIALNKLYIRLMSLPEHGEALWFPSPALYWLGPAQIGDVGVVIKGRFYRKFNVLLPKGVGINEMGVPDDFEHIPFEEEDPEGIIRRPLEPQITHFNSSGVTITMTETEDGRYAQVSLVLVIDFKLFLFVAKSMR